MFRPKFPIVTVAFEGDFRLTVLQAVSIDRLYDMDTLSDYIVILNGEDNRRLRERFESAFSKLSVTFRRAVRFVDWSDLYEVDQYSGYYDQQALKLGISRFIFDDFYLLLDGKNHFLYPADSSIFFDGQKPIASMERLNSDWQDKFWKSLETVGLGKEGAPEFVMQSVTPYLMITDEVRSLVNYLELTFGEPLPKFLRLTGGTEFMLYYSYLLKAGRFELYSPSKMPYRTLFTSWPQDEAIVEEYIGALGSEVPIFGLHRKRLPQLSAMQVEMIDTKWHENLLQPWENSGWFLESNESE